MKSLLLLVLLVVAGVALIVWRVLGRLVVEYARMEAEERIEDNAPERTPASRPPNRSPIS